MKVSALFPRFTVVLGCLALAHGLAAEDSSLSDSNLETAEAKVTSETLFSQNDDLRKQLSLDRETQKTLTDSLVVSNAGRNCFAGNIPSCNCEWMLLGSNRSARTGRNSSSVC